MDYEIHRSTRHCAKTGRELKPGETFYSVLNAAGAELVREDFSAEAWEGPPEGAIGWWKSHVPSPDARKLHWAPNDVMLDLFEQLADDAAGRGDLFGQRALGEALRAAARTIAGQQHAARRVQAVGWIPDQAGLAADERDAAIDLLLLPEARRIEALRK